MTSNINYISAVKEALTNADMHYSFKKRENSAIFRIPVAAKNLPEIIVSMRVYDDGDIKFTVYPVKKVADRFRRDVAELLNEFNDRYRFSCFSLDSDGDVCVDYDMMLMTADPKEFGKKLIFLAAMFADIVDDSYLPLLLASRCGLAVSRTVSNIAGNDDDDDDNDDDDDDDDDDGEEQADEDSAGLIDDLYSILSEKKDPVSCPDAPDEDSFGAAEYDDDDEDSF